MEEKGQQVVTTKSTRVFDKIHRTVAENCPLRRSIHRLPLLRSMISVSGNDDVTVSPGHPRGKTRSTTTTTADSPSKTHFHIGKIIAPHKTHPAGEVNIPIEPGSSVTKNTGRFRDKTGIPVQTQATTKPQHGFQSKLAVKHTAAHKDGPGNIGGGGGHDHNHKYSSYIEHVKNQLRSKSDIGEEIIMAGPTATRMPAKRDSFNDRISNFITRAKKNIKMTHIGE